MIKKINKESIYKEYERYICDEMDDYQKSQYVKSRTLKW